MHHAPRALFTAALLLAGGANAQNITATIVVTTPGDIGGHPNRCSLREAIANVNAAAKVGLNSCAAGAPTLTNETTLIDLSGLAKPVVLKKGELNMSANNVVIRGGVIDALGSGRLLTVGGDVRMYLESLTLRGGLLQGANESGAAIRVQKDAWLTIRDSTIEGNFATDRGGGVHFEGSGELFVERSRFDSNSASFGGAIYIADTAGRVSIRNSTFSSNAVSNSGGAIKSAGKNPLDVWESRFEFNVAGTAGGAALLGSPTTIRRTDFEGNAVLASKFYGDGGGALYFAEGLFLSEFKSSIHDSRFLGNYATGKGAPGSGAILALQALNISGSSFAANYADAGGGAIGFYGADGTVLQNSTFASNSTLYGKASAIDINVHAYNWWIDPALPLGGQFPLTFIHNSFYDNNGAAQVNLHSAGSYGPLLFLNNIMHSTDGTAGCSGHMTKWLFKRPNDNSAAAPNVQWPDSSCGPDVPTRDNTLGPHAVGGVWGQAYRNTDLLELGDQTACAFVGSVDQFAFPRLCLMGAVEREVPPSEFPDVP